MSAGPYSIRPSSRRKSFNCFGPRANGTPASGAFRRHSKTSLEPLSQPRPHGPGIVKNANTKLIGQQPGDMSALESQLHLNEVRSPRSSDSVRRKRADSRRCCWSSGRSRRRPKRCDWFQPPSTTGSARHIRASVRIEPGLEAEPEQPLLECYEELARKFPQGFAGLPQLPEELSGAVHTNEAIARLGGLMLLFTTYLAVSCCSAWKAGAA
jgi:hypothetical protein